METIRPFVFFQPRILFLNQARVSIQQANALHTYLTLIKDIPEKRVYRLVIDQCAMTDDVFAKVLDGVIS